jgi:hypothetical protein
MQMLFEYSCGKINTNVSRPGLEFSPKPPVNGEGVDRGEQ